MGVAAEASPTKHTRFWEIDVLRTNAVLVMIVFHTLYLRDYFGIQHFDLHHLYWLWFAGGGGTFMFLAGLSLTITYARGKSISGFVLRGVKIFGLGMVLTLITLLISRTMYIRFGILHFFGIAFILAPSFVRFRYINLILGAAVMALGIYLLGHRVSVGFPWLLWLIPYNFGTMDYWPMVPWFGLFLLGMFFGKILYPQGNRRFHMPSFNNAILSALTLPGRHPLEIYLAQWPAVIVILLLLYPAHVLPYFPF
ncbi:MAG: heparan-alpha-glucosaminide N-acetyltransferase [Dehalococcoidia bacterium]